MAESPVQRLESQVGEILELYDFGEKLQSYDQLHGDRSLNEDQRRRNMVALSSTSGTSAQILQGNSLFGLASLYLYSRRGASGLLDMSRLRACGWTSLTVFLLGSTFGSIWLMEKEKMRLSEESIDLNTAVRVHQNEQTHSLLRSMKFHLTTRQMSLWDQDPR